MAKKKSPAQLETHVVRIHNGDYAILCNLGMQLDVSVGDALNHLIRKLVEIKPELAPKSAPERKPEPEPIQFSFVHPVKVKPARSTPVTTSFSHEVEYESRYRQTNGH